MHNRVWFYLFVLIVIGAEISYLVGINSRTASEIELLNQAAERQSVEQIENYASGQTDGYKLVSLSKKLGSDASAKVHEILVLRAYELEPTDRDITVLASYFDARLEPKITELDPLYKK
ncbi:hypothetical protein HY844_02625 [Candidatus Berkelbacteria bacterium]|nr:hypothetical protein [Candidatus Berkelbacteria bacterium]